MTAPIVPWMGGKRRLADRILPFFPRHKCYVEPFAGGAALYFLKSPSEVEVINDLNGELVNLYRVVKHHLEEFVSQFKWALSSRKVFEWEQGKSPEPLTDIQRAARFYYLQHLAFGAKIQGQTYGTATTAPPGLDLTRIGETLTAAWMRLTKTYIENLSWEKCVEKYDREHTFFFMDPPYWQTEGYGLEFGFDQYQKMADMLSGLNGKAIITLNDHPDIRSCFSAYPMETVEIEYTVGGGKGKPAKEVLIFSWDVKAEPAGLF